MSKVKTSEEVSWFVNSIEEKQLQKKKLHGNVKGKRFLNLTAKK